MPSSSSLSSSSSVSTSSSSLSSYSSLSSASSSSSSSQSSSGQFNANLYVASSTLNLHIQAFRFRDVRYEVMMLDADGEVIPIDSTNVLKVKIGKKSVSPHLELSSVAPSARGSQIVLGNPFGLILTSADLQFAAGIYDVEILVLDNATSAIITSLKHGVFALHETMRGS